MIIDVWHGLGIYQSSDATHWQAQLNTLLAEPGLKPTDRDKGHHADVVVSGDRTFLFYFVHQIGPDAQADDLTTGRHTVIQVVELSENNGQLNCDRNGPTRVRLLPPRD